MNLMLLQIIGILSFSISYRAHAEVNDRFCPRKIRVGVSLPLTAGAVASGEAVKNSIVLADERYDHDKCVEFIFEDDQLLAKNTVGNIRKFLDVDHVDALIVYGTPTSLAVTDVVESAKVPMIALSILGKVVQGKRCVVKHWCSAERLNAAVIAEATRRGYKKVAVVSTQNDAMLGLRDLFRTVNAFAITLDEEFVRDNFDFATVVTKIANANPDAVYVLLYPPQTGPFVKRLREAGYRGEMFGVHNIEDPNEVKSSNGKMIGMWLANGDESAGEHYPAEYRERFHEETSLGGGSGFDSAKLLIEATYHEADLNRYLHTVRNFEGAFGTYSATAQNDFDFPAVIKLVEKNGFRTLSIGQ